MSMHKEDSGTKKNIYESSKALFYEKGYFNTSIGDISIAAGTNRALISYYFQNKANLALEITNEFTLNIRKEMIKKINQKDKVIDPVVSIAVEFRLFTYFRKSNSNYRRFIKELSQENVMLLGRDNIGFQIYDKVQEFYNIELSDIDKKIAHYSMTSIINGLIIVHGEGLIDCSHEYIAEKECEMLFRILGFDASVIQDILEKSKVIYDNLNITMGQNFIIQ